MNTLRKTILKHDPKRPPHWGFQGKGMFISRNGFTQIQRMNKNSITISAIMKAFITLPIVFAQFSSHTQDKHICRQNSGCLSYSHFEMYRCRGLGRYTSSQHRFQVFDTTPFLIEITKWSLYRVPLRCMNKTTADSKTNPRKLAGYKVTFFEWWYHFK